MQKYFQPGEQRWFKPGTETADAYGHLAYKDEEAADVLTDKGFYNQAAYLYIQSLEKRLKVYICRKVDVNSQAGDEYLRSLGHSVDQTVNAFLKLHDSLPQELRETLEKQLKEMVLKGVHFGYMHNAVRYPSYNIKHCKYSMRVLSFEDCKALKQMCVALENYLEAFVRLVK